MVAATPAKPATGVPEGDWLSTNPSAWPYAEARLLGAISVRPPAAFTTAMPPLPKPDKHGRFPALEYARISLARDLIRDRTGVGLSQQRLADLAGVRQETLSRIETGKHTASQRTVDKIMRAVEAERRRSRKRR